MASEAAITQLIWSMYVPNKIPVCMLQTNDYGASDISDYIQSGVDGEFCMVDIVYVLIGCPAAMILYEYIITFDQEVKLFWNKKWNGATTLFLVNRYLVLFLRLCNLIGFVPMPEQVRIPSLWSK